MEYKIALLIDAENISDKYLDIVVREVSNFGRIVFSRFYANINKLNDDWNKKAVDLAIKPMHQYNVATKKNAADMALALDAMEIMYKQLVDAFVIVSSDSDFTPLSTKLKEGGMYVIGIGSEEKVTNAFKASCNEFKYFEYLSTDKEDKDKSIQSDDNSEKLNIEKEITNIIIENGIDNRLMLSKLGDILINRYSDFDPRQYGAKTLTGLVQTIKGLLISKDNTTTYVSIEMQERGNIEEDIVMIISRNKSKVMKLSKLMQEIKKMHKDFDYNTYGFTKFKKFLLSINGISITKNDEAKIVTK